MTEKPLTIESISQNRQKGVIKRLVFVSGVFNILHPGHFRLLRFAKECGDFLVVTVLADKKTSWPAIISESDRLYAIESISLVDYAMIAHTSIETILSELRPDIVVKGVEYEGGLNPEVDILDSYGGKVIYCSGEISFSSVDLIAKEIGTSDFSTIIKPIDYLERHNLTLNQLRKSLDEFKNLNICVIGDSIVDEYINCEPVGMSQEDPTLVVTPITEKKFIGGAGIVASNASSLGSNVRYISVIGDDGEGEFISGKLDKFGVISHLEKDKSRPTTIKTRYRSSEKTLLRVNNFRQHHISLSLQDSIMSYINKHANDFDLLIFSDFNYGILPQKLVERIIEVCQKNEIIMAADSQCSSQVGDISRFNDMMLLTPTEREARLAMHDFESGLVTLTEKLRQKSKSRNIIVTLGSEGLLIHADKENEWVTDQLPAFNKMPTDVVGAGDVFLVCASIMMSKGKSIWEAAYIGALAAACQVGKVGNIPITLHELKKELSD